MAGRARLGTSSSVVLGISLVSTSAEGQQCLLLSWWYVAKIWDGTDIAEAASAKNGRSSQGLVKAMLACWRHFQEMKEVKLTSWTHHKICWLSCEYDVCWGNRLEEQEGALRHWKTDLRPLARRPRVEHWPCTRPPVFSLLCHKVHGR